MSKQEKIQRNMVHTVSVQSLKFSYSLYIPVKENKQKLFQERSSNRSKGKFMLVVKQKWQQEIEYWG